MSPIRPKAGGPGEWRQAMQALDRVSPCHPGDHDYVRFLAGDRVHAIRCVKCGRSPIDELAEMRTVQ